MPLTHLPFTHLAFTHLLRTIVNDGSVCIVDPAGREQIIGDGSPPLVTLRLTPKAPSIGLIFNPALKVGEAYMDGCLKVEQGSIHDFLDVMARNYATMRNSPWLDVLGRLQDGWTDVNLLERSRRNVAHHYDLSSNLYDAFLDKDRQYSCAYFRSPDDDLETAQENKKRHIAAKLKLDRPGLKVLDIGSGWGGLALYLAEEFGAEVTGVTLSTEQQSLSAQRASRSPAGDRVHFELRDYREVEGPFDRIVSVGMFEHVGKRQYRNFFRRVRDLLTDEGIALIHSIGYSDAPAPINPFMRKYIFPGADLPSLSEVFAAIERADLWISDVEILRLHYAETLRHWRERFLARWDDVEALYDARFCRMWEYYLALCEVGFRRRTNMVFQLQLTRQVDAAPITRDYIIDAERLAEDRERKRP
ncbi:MAG: cyclopropane-fatty-acyl-phospholipid synthase family protein [Rhodovibrionaceae bacterium]|nr:cyclopropane-fatty-acyl-phospholipid synthase family protein [Rhodovibrionaceae bacterium]